MDQRKLMSVLFGPQNIRGYVSVSTYSDDEDTFDSNDNTLINVLDEHIPNPRFCTVEELEALIDRDDVKKTVRDVISMARYFDGLVPEVGHVVVPTMDAFDVYDDGYFRNVLYTVTAIGLSPSDFTHWRAGGFHVALRLNSVDGLDLDVVLNTTEVAYIRDRA